MRNALIAGHSDFEIDARRPFYPQIHRTNLTFDIPAAYPHNTVAALVGRSLAYERNSGRARVTAQGKSCRCKDLSLQCREEILPHQYIFQANMGSPRDAVCRGQGCRRDNPPLPPLTAARPRGEAAMLPPSAV